MGACAPGEKTQAQGGWHTHATGPCPRDADCVGDQVPFPRRQFCKLGRPSPSIVLSGHLYKGHQCLLALQQWPGQEEGHLRVPQDPTVQAATRSLEDKG